MWKKDTFWGCRRATNDATTIINVLNVFFFVLQTWGKLHFSGWPITEQQGCDVSHPSLSGMIPVGVLMRDVVRQVWVLLG